MNASRFHPVVPNITDDSMIPKDKEIDYARRQSNKDKEKDKEKSNDGNSDKTKSDKTTPEGSFGRKVIIGILIVIIVVLLILLIYQIYKYYSEDVVSQAQHKRYQNNIPEYTKKPDPPKESESGRLPDNVRNMDNDILSQFVQKNGNAKQQHDIIDSKIEHGARMSSYNTALSSIPETSNTESIRIEEIIDNARHGQTEVTPDDDDETFDKGNILRQMKRDMTQESSHMDTVSKFTGDTDCIIDMFSAQDCDGDGSVGSDNDESNEASAGCAFVLTRGNNAGTQCGRVLSTADRCTRHVHK